jgi:hypothetical protein
MTHSTCLSDAEIDEICEGLVQPLAKVRYLTSLGLHVLRKPNGAPLVNRAHFDAITGNCAKSSPLTSSGPVWGVH